jgi:hypothetical protein
MVGGGVERKELCAMQERRVRVLVRLCVEREPEGQMSMYSAVGGIGQRFLLNRF